MLNEVYKDIVGFEGIYQVSNFGNVKNQHGKILKQYKINSGYLYKRYSTELEAARARDAIVLAHNLNLPLNF